MIYVSTACYKANKIYDVITAYAKAEIKYIELSGGTDWYDGIESDLTALKERYNLTYVCHSYFPPPKEHFVVNLASCDDEIYLRSVTHYDNCVELLKKARISALSIHAGSFVQIAQDEIGKELNRNVVYNREKSFDRFCAAYKNLSKKCADYNIDLFLENHVLSAGNYERFRHNNLLMMTDYDSIVEMKKRTGFQLLLDIGHLHVSSHTLGLSFEDQCEKLAPMAKWLHISDNDGITDRHRPFDRNSSILKSYKKYFHPNLNMTLETNGTISEILKSLEELK